MKKESNLTKKIFSPNNISKEYIELYNLQIILKESIKNIRTKVCKKGKKGMIHCQDVYNIINEEAGDNLT